MKLLRFLAIERVLRGCLIIALGFEGLMLSPQRKGSLDTWNDALGKLNRFNPKITNSVLHSSLYQEIFKLQRGEPTRWVILFLLISIYGIFITFEGVGLWLDVLWIEKMTVISTAVFIPVEIWELIHKTSALKVSALAINIIAVIWLYKNKWQKSKN